MRDVVAKLKVYTSQLYKYFFIYSHKINSLKNIYLYLFIEDVLLCHSHIIHTG